MPTPETASTSPLAVSADIAIVGLGFSGVALLWQLAATLPPQTRLHVYEPGTPGEGLAYRTHCDRHLMNVPAGRLSIDADIPLDFVDWLHGHGQPAAAGGDFVPRRAMARYLADRYRMGCTLARQRGVRVRARRGEVVAVQAMNDRQTGPDGPWRLTCDDGHVERAHVVVLATGHGRCPPPSIPVAPSSDQGTPPALRWDAAPGLHADPWQAESLARIHPDDRVLMLGTGLTAVDVLLALHDRGHRGPVAMLSRRGLLPQPHSVRSVVGAPRPTLPPGETARALMRQLRHDVDDAAARGEDWRPVFDSWRVHTPTLWSRLDDVERRRFLRHAAVHWDTHRHRMAPRVAASLATARRDGLQVLAGRVVDVDGKQGAWQVRYRPRGLAVSQTLAVDHIVNCTGVSNNLARETAPMVAGLREAGWVAADRLGLGWRCDDSGAALDAAGRPTTRLHVLGPALKGRDWETVAIPELRTHAAALARRLTQARLWATRAASTRADVG